MGVEQTGTNASVGAEQSDTNEPGQRHK